MAGFQKEFRRQLAAEQKKAARAERARLTARIRELEQRRREATKRVRDQCKAARVRLRQRIKDFRARERERINAEVGAMRKEARARCKARLERVKKIATTERERRKRAKAEEVKLQRLLERAERHKAREHARSRKAERRQESDDEVRQNIPAELVPIFDRVRRHIRGTPKLSRTEAFMHWAEENPGEVVAMRDAAMEAELNRLLKEKARLDRQEAKRRARAKDDEDVPF